MISRVLVTGSAGLVGTAASAALHAAGFEVTGLDLRAAGAAQGDVRDKSNVKQAIDACHGVIHLAAVSRVIEGERNPERCWSTNVGGLRNLLSAAVESSQRPWVIFASSREVYGEPDELPVDEDAALRPMNVYGRSKVEGEALVAAARRDGLSACVLRLSNVFGSTQDHVDRVVPAFARGAVLGKTLRVDGEDHTFDFTHVSEVGRGVVALAELMNRERTPPPPIHLVTGVGTTLGQLARLAIDLAGSRSTIQHAPERDFDVHRFVGVPNRARELLGWSATIPVRQGLKELIAGFQRELGAGGDVESAP